METQSKDGDSLEKRPGVFFLGSPGVGKRSLISRLLRLDFDDASDSSSSSQLAVDGWNISTKYYTAGVSYGWLIGHLHDEFLVVPPNKWVSRTDLQKFDILVCVGNKVDLVPGYPVHTEYRRRLQKLGDPFADDGPGFTAYGISETEGSSLLGDDEPFWEARHTCLCFKC